MSSNVTLSAATKNLGLDAELDQANSGTIEIYDGTQPAGPATAITTQNKLVTLTFGATAFGAASAGSKAANSITSGTAIATGTPTWARWKKSGGAAFLDCTVGASGCDINLSGLVSGQIISGGTVSVASLSGSM